MEKTISINLNNQNFQIEEEAYEKLALYLESIKRHCGAGADSAEVISDIENSIAEKLKLTLNSYKEVITIADVESLIKIMGTVEDFDREVGNPNPEDLQSPEDENDKRLKRKLYRDTDNAVIGGVAAGLGNYFNIDPVLFRIIFCALIFAGGSAVPIYIILWIVMPEAKSAHQKLEMQGQAPTIAAFKNLVKTGNKIKANWKNRWEKRSPLGKIISLPLLIINGIFLALKKVWEALWPIIGMFFGLLLILVALSVLVGVGIGSLYLLLQAQSNYSFNFIPVRELSASIPLVWLLITGFLSLALPSFLAIIGGLAIIQRKKLISFQLAALIFGLWIIAGIAFSALGLRYVPELKYKVDNYPSLQQTTKTIDLENFSNLNARGNSLKVVIKPGTGTSSRAVISGRAVDLAQIALQKNSIDLNIDENRTNRAYCLGCNLEQVIVRIYAPALKSLDVKAADIEISSEFKQALKITASGTSVINWSDAAAPSLEANLTGYADLSVDGRIASTSLIINNANAHFTDFSGSSLSLSMKGEASKTDWKGKVDNFNISSVKGEDSDGSVDASALTVKKMIIDSQGALIIVSGPSSEIQTNLSDNSRLYYTKGTKISGDQKNKPLVQYIKVSAAEYNDAEDNYDDSLGLIINSDSSLISASNGKYFRLLKGELPNTLFQTISVDFKRWVD
ncbi:MAG: PspC domain-containing protein [Patescibacteria group bacterium]